MADKDTEPKVIFSHKWWLKVNEFAAAKDVERSTGDKEWAKRVRRDLDRGFE